MTEKTATPIPFAERLRRFWQRWGRAAVIAIVAHVCIGAAIVVLYYVTKPPPPRYVVVDLLPASASPSPSAVPSPVAD